MSEAKATEQICCSENGDKMQNKLKILAIHGYRQNGEVFRQKTGSFRKMVHKWAQFTYITAPHKVIPVDDLNKIEEIDISQSPDAEQYGWFFNRDDKTFRGIRKGGPAIGFEESVAFIEKVFEEEGPFDGVLGFSQGGCFVGLLCDLQNRGLLKCKFDFAIMASGFKSNALPHAKYFDDLIMIPSLHIFGEGDNIIPLEMSNALLESFEEGVKLIHPGGHYLPASAPQKHEYQKFFKVRLLQKEYFLKEKLKDADDK